MRVEQVPIIVRHHGIGVCWPLVDVHAHIQCTAGATPPVAPGGQSFAKYLARMAQTNIVAAIPSTADGAGGPYDLADLMRGLSAGRLLFGSYAPYCDYRLPQQVIEAVRIDAPRKDRLTWGNAAGLIRRFRPGWTPPCTPPALPDEFADVDLWRQQQGKPGCLL